MTGRSCILLALALLAAGSTGCAQKLFGINLFVVGEKTSLERQVLGNYAEIGRDLSAYASVRGVSPDGTMKPAPRTTESQAAVLQALGNRRYNRDDLDALLTGGVVGEGNNGKLVVLQETAQAVGQLTPELVARLIEEENRDRGVILDRLMKTTPNVTEADQPEVAWIFATLNQDLAPAGARFQTKSGAWKTK
ncbi:DUF1318 domain-containing protein [Candidatus Sumerlaeota bacterium]|nr:DUF1318 domain-containing protein [Candidatus Sumerlaeota bacterium]